MYSQLARSSLRLIYELMLAVVGDMNLEGLHAVCVRRECWGRLTARVNVKCEGKQDYSFLNPLSGLDLNYPNVISSTLLP